ncbi:MAG: N-acetylmuramoyl-L-alanine amidase [Myxococcota bacterium]
MRLAPLMLLLLAAPPESTVDRDATRDVFDVVVIDPGHGGADRGARGVAGGYEKDVVLRVALRLGEVLEKRGLRVVYTRTRDRFLTLADRATLANREHGDLYLSIHANWALDHEARGPETYFLSLDATDEDALRVALVENQVFGREATVPDGDDIVGPILGDLILTDHLRGSSEIAAAIQRNLARLPGPDRGVKQAPFVVLMGVNMPAALVEIGFMSHPEEAKRLGTRRYQKRLAEALAKAVLSYRAARESAHERAAAR